jgi:Ca2+-binding EF-hand superfamily protein
MLHELGLHGFNVNSPVACVNMDDFRNFMITLGGEGPGRLIDGNYCKASDTDCVFVAANVVDRAKRSQFKVLPDKGLTRFQFLEGVVRLSLRRFLTSPASSSTTSSCIAAIKGFFDLTHMGQNLRDQRKTFQDALFNEECCMIYREHLDTLKGIYEGYKTILPNPGRSGKSVSYAAWLHMLTEANVINENFTREMCGAAFALAKEIHTDVNSDWRLMELTWSEFLLSLAAIVRLSPAWDREFFSDFLDELFTEHLEEAYSKLLSKHPGTQKVFKNVDPALQPMVNFLSGIFEDADDNNSGTVDVREFKRALKPPRVKAEMHHLGFNLSDVEVLFRTIDLDNKGEVTVDKLVDGFVKMKTAMRGMEKAMNFVRKSFAEADKDANGVLDDHEFHELFKQPAILKKLQVLGVNLDDVEDLFAIVDKEGQGQVAVEEIIRGFVALRDPETRVVRGMRLLRQLFDEADSDGNGSLDLHQVSQRLRKQK